MTQEQLKYELLTQLGYTYSIKYCAYIHTSEQKFFSKEFFESSSLKLFCSAIGSNNTKTHFGRMWEFYTVNPFTTKEKQSIIKTLAHSNRHKHEDAIA